MANFGFSTMTSPKRRDKRRGRKSEIGTPASSQWYTTTTNGTNNSNSVSNNSVSNNSVSNSSVSNNNETPTASPLRELRQELVTERPLRAEVERERRLSQRTSFLTSSAPPSNRDSMGTTDSNQDEEEPPPLPQKSSQSHRSLDATLDSENNNETPIPARYNYDTVWTPRGSFLYNSIANRRHTTNNVDKPPTPPPKKKHVNNS